MAVTRYYGEDPYVSAMLDAWDEIAAEWQDDLDELATKRENEYPADANVAGMFAQSDYEAWSADRM